MLFQRELDGNHPSLLERVPLRKLHGFARALRREWSRNKLTDAAAALTFYGILALFPFILFIVTAASLIIRPEQVQALGGALARDTPPALAPILLARLAELTSRPRLGLLTFSALTTVFSSTTGVASLVTALNSAYGVSERRPQWKVYTIAFTVMLGAALLALLAAVVAVVDPIAAKQSGASWQPLVGWQRLPVATSRTSATSASPTEPWEASSFSWFGCGFRPWL